MNKRHPILVFVILALLATAPFSSAQAQQPSEEQLARILKRFPEADTDKDGKLTTEEIQQFRQSRQRNTRPAAAAQPKEIKTPTHAKVSYGSEDRQWLNLYLPSGDEPTPVFLYAHHNGSTANDVQSSWADPTVAAGTAIVSWESIAKVQGMADFQTCAADAKVMFAWVKENAATYNFDVDKILIGGQSRGSFVSWELAHSQDKGIVGIYMGQALPGQSFNERLLEPITKKAPPIFLAYRKEPGVVGDIHDPAHGLRVLEKYKELGIGDSAELVHSLSETKNSHVMQFLPKFVRSVTKPKPSNAQAQQPSEEQLAKMLKRFPKADTDKDGKLTTEEAQQFRQSRQRKTPPAAAAQPTQAGDAVQGEGKASVEAPSVGTGEVAAKWKTIGFQQANSMGGGEAAISKSGKFRVFVLMGQSNMNGSGRATELEAPYNQKHDRIRIWANGRWEYLVPSNKFGPGVSLAHQLADFWPDDTIGIIKVSRGATGISAFEKNWSFERAQRSKDGNKGSLYKDLMNAVAEAKRISQPEFCGFVWKQGAADGKKGLAEEYYDNFKQLISDLSADLGVTDLPTFVPSYATDKELLKGILSRIDKEDALEAKKSAGKGALKTEEMLDAVLTYIDANGLFSSKSPVVKKQRYLATVIAAQNKAGRDMPNVTTLYPGKLPTDGVHYNSEGYITLGKITASAVEEFYKAKE